MRLFAHLKALFFLISANQSENIALAALRDALLPRLISGEIDVSAIYLLSYNIETRKVRKEKMKLSWTDVKDVFQEYTVWTHNQEMGWFEGVWSILDQKGLTIWNSAVEKLAVYNRIYGVVWIFHNFCAAGFEEDASFDFYGLDAFQSALHEMETADAEAELVFDKLICDHQVVYTIFGILKEHMGTEQLFASLWAVCCPEEIEDNEESFDEDFSLIMNENLETEKQAAYEWLMEYLK